MAIESLERPDLGSEDDPRYVLVDTETGEVVCDANGYGYKSPEKAFAAYSYLQQKKQVGTMENRAKIWLENHPGFLRLLDAYRTDMDRGGWVYRGEIDIVFVSRLLKDAKIRLGFPVRELMWELERREDLGKKRSA